MFVRVEDDSVNMLKTYTVRLNNLLNSKRVIAGEKVDYSFNITMNKNSVLLGVDADDANMYFNTACDTTSEMVKFKFYLYEEKSMIGKISNFLFLKTIVTKEKRFYLFQELDNELETVKDGKKITADIILDKVEEVNGKMDTVISTLNRIKLK